MTLTCAFCGLIYKRRRNLNMHMKQFHATVMDTLPALPPPCQASLLCSVCSTDQCEVRLTSTWEFRQHLYEAHDVEVEMTIKHFDSFEEFCVWKGEFEQETCSYFVKSRGVIKSSQAQKVLYACHRSGIYKPSGKGLRRVKTQGSKKIGGYCPASLHVQVQSDGKCVVRLVTTHWGHNQELAHISLTAAEKEFIAKEMAANVSASEILKRIQEYSSQTNMKRLSLLTKKDLYNISVSYNAPNKWMKHQSDDISVSEWVKEMRDLPEDCIFIYKPQGFLCEEYPTLTDQDFCLGLMTRAQDFMLRSYGDNVICATSTRGLNYHLVTLMVIDDMNEGFPCTFLFTNRTDKDVLSLLFSQIRNRLGGVILSPELFVSDVTHSFHSAWIHTFNRPKETLFCPWNVDQTWKKNLSRVKRIEKKPQVYEIMKSLVEEPDEDVFNEKFPAVIKNFISDYETKNFGAFLKVNFVKNPQHWASCYRLQCGPNTNSYVESLQKCIEYFQSEARNPKRLDKALVATLNFLNRKTLDRFIAVNEDETLVKVEEIKARHRLSLEMKTETLSQSGSKWTVTSEDGTQTYVVLPYREECSCSLICEDCGACIHQYECSCIDCILSCNMCQHVHLVITEIRRLQCAPQPQKLKRARKNDSLRQLRARINDTPILEAHENTVYITDESGRLCHFQLQPISPPPELVEPEEKIARVTEITECVEPTLGIAEVWAQKLLTLDPEQRELAEEAITDILFEASLGALHRQSVKINDRMSSTFSAQPSTMDVASVQRKLDSSGLINFFSSFNQ